MYIRLLIAVGLMLNLAVCLGCGTSAANEDPQLLAHRNKFLLEDEPSGLMDVSEARDAVSAGDTRVVVLGRISAGEHSPWDDGRASFVITDAVAVIDDHDHHGDGHDHENCPFCNKGKSTIDSLAVVKMLDEHGDVLKIDARRLLGVAENQLVVVRGHAEVDELDSLVIHADGVYIRE